MFYSECSEEDRAFADTRLGSEPVATVGTPLALTAERWGQMPRV
jgi:hypothetical protein